MQFDVRTRQRSYMPALVAMRCNPDLKAKHENLRTTGKPAKVAVMRKLIETANALVKADRTWIPETVRSRRILLVYCDDGGLFFQGCHARQGLGLAVFKARSGQKLDAARKGMVQTASSRDMGPDRARRATEARFQPSAESNLLCLRHTGLTALPAVESKRIPAILQVGIMPAPDGVVVQVEKPCDPSTAFPVVEQQDSICTTGNTVVLALATHARLKLDTICRGKKAATDHRHS